MTDRLPDQLANLTVNGTNAARADQVSTERDSNRPLTATDVGPNAFQVDRPWISAPEIAADECDAAGGGLLDTDPREQGG